MKSRLNQFTMSQFIDIACGDYSHINAEPATAKNIADSLISQYNDTTDPVSSKARVYEQEKLSRSRCRLALYGTLLNLVNVYKAYDEVRDILKSVGDYDVVELDDEKLCERLELMYRQEGFKKDRLEFERGKNVKNVHDKEASEEEIRDSFDKQTARLMAHFKMSINHDKITASVYANLVNIALRQQREMSANSNKPAGK